MKNGRRVISERQMYVPEKNGGSLTEGSSPRDLSSLFGCNTFNDRVMREKLAKDIYLKLRNTIRTGAKLDMEIANSVAHAMKEWAIEKGVTHFTHWFQPQTGLTAEKHDAFLEVERDGIVIERFRGNQLVQGEPDASSFPSGGARTTFEARGYTMWDPSSPAFIIEGPRGGILCIPSVFISYHGDALDNKTPLLRSMEALDRAALHILRLFLNSHASRVVPTIGTEQEYFLIDQEYYRLRPDVQITGRTLMGAKPPKGQQLEDHYFGSIKERALGFMQEVELELHKLGVPVKTRHNEVAPHQFELAPIFSEANVGSDRNQLTMEILKKVGNRHGLAVLLHEKPFAGINGSGKHNNWSLEDSEGNNLLDPGKTPGENLQFLVFLVSVLRAVHRYGDLLRASIASAGNDHRLGANEAPPAIMSVYLGRWLNDILDNIRQGKKNENAENFVIDLGIGKLPQIFQDHTDRNRTSPFAFTGSKFEFRAIGSSASVSLANTVLNAAVAESLEEIGREIEAGARKKEFDRAVLDVLKKTIIETEPVRFDGNNYCEDWKKEAERRGLSNVKSTAYALDAFLGEKNKKLLTDLKILTAEEIESRYITRLEQYIRALEIEADTFCELIHTRVIPAAISYEDMLVRVLKGFKEIAGTLGIDEPVRQAEILKTVSGKIEALHDGCRLMREKIDASENLEPLSRKAKFFADHIVDLMSDVRRHADDLESLIPDDLWPLPKYSEMLFMM